MLFSACAQAPPASSNSAPPAMSGVGLPGAGAEIALITTAEQLETSFGQGVWNSIIRFAGEAGITHASYKAEADDPDAALSTLELAVKGGARMVVSMGASVTAAVADAQRQYPEVDFILLDAGDDARLRDNGAALQFSAPQAGWLAGYMAVWQADGAPVAVLCPEGAQWRRYALGFLLGAQAAAEERDDGPVEVYWLLRPEDEDAPGDAGSAPASAQRPQDMSGIPEETAWPDLLQLLAAKQPDVVFAAGPDAAADAITVTAGGVMGPGMALDGGARVLAVPARDARNLVYNTLTRWVDGNFPGGTALTGSVAGGGVLLLMDYDRLFDRAEYRYQAALDRFANGVLGRQLDALLGTAAGDELPLPEDLGLDALLLRHPADEAALAAGEGATDGGPGPDASSVIPGDGEDGAPILPE